MAAHMVHVISLEDEISSLRKAKVSDAQIRQLHQLRLKIDLDGTYAQESTLEAKRLMFARYLYEDGKLIQ